MDMTAAQILAGLIHAAITRRPDGSFITLKDVAERGTPDEVGAYFTLRLELASLASIGWM